MSELEDLVSDLRGLSAGLLMKAEEATRDSPLLHRFVELKQELETLADFLESVSVKKHSSD